MGLGLVALLGLALASAAVAAATDVPSTPATKPASASLEQCITSTEQAGRSATFAGEMTVVPGSAKMQMRVDVLERGADELAFHDIASPGLGVWRTAAPGVKVFKYLKQVTNLAAPASYRGDVRFRWLNGKGKTIKVAEMRTSKCQQPVKPKGLTGGEGAPPSTTSTTGTGSGEALG
ncbi:MAG TPA: hypothetical protein VGG08_11890 [Solirubrobacteraceae bacterium]